MEKLIEAGPEEKHKDSPESSLLVSFRKKNMETLLRLWKELKERTLPDSVIVMILGPSDLFLKDKEE